MYAGKAWGKQYVSTTTEQKNEKSVRKASVSGIMDPVLFYLAAGTFEGFIRSNKQKAVKGEGNG